MVGWRYAGPFDDLPAVRTAFAAGTRDDPDHPYQHVVVAWSEVGEDEGTGIVHIAPGCGAEDFQLGKELGLPVVAPLDEAGDLRRRLRLPVRDRRPRRRRPDRRAPQARGPLLPARDHHPPLPALLALRDAARLPPRRRVVHQHGPALRPAARDADQGAGRRQPALPDHGRRRPDPLDPRLRLRARARLAAQHARLDDQQEALLGAGAADLRLLGVRHGSRSSAAATSSRSVPSRAGTTFEGHTPHRPYVDAVKIACPELRGAGRADQATSATRGSTPGSCRSRRSTTARTPSTGGSGSRPTSSPRASPASSATGSTRCSRCPRSCAASRRSRTIFGYATLFARGRPPDAQELGQHDRVRRGRRPDGRRRHALDVRQVPARGEHPVRLARGGRGAARAADPVERLLVLRDLRPAGRLEPDRGGAAGRRSGRVLDRWILSRAAGTAGAVEASLREYGRDGRRARAVRLPRRPVDVVPAAVAPAVLAVGRSDATRTPRSRRSTRPSWRRPGCWPRSCRSSPRSLYENLVTTVVADAPDSVHLTRWPTAELAPHRDEGLERSMAVAQAAVDLARTLRSSAGLKTRQPLATGLDRRAGPRPGDRRRTAAAHRRRDQRQGGRPHRRRVRRSSSGGSSRSCPRSGSGSGRRSPR